jgi:hypothetical protein
LKGDAISFAPLVLLPRLPPCADLKEALPKGVPVALARDASLLCHSLSRASCFCTARLRKETMTHAPPTMIKTAMTMPAVAPDEREDAEEAASERTAKGFAVGAAIPLTLLDSAEHSV